jgi:CheY-like chemotaxis protein
VFGQNSKKNENLETTPTVYQTNEVNLNDQILKYQEFLRDETKLHREYTQEYYAMILKLFSLIAVLVGAVLTWLNWKSKKDVKEQVNLRFQETVQGLLDKKLKTVQELLDEQLRQSDLLINENKEKSAKQFEKINKMILELSAKSDKINEQTSQNFRENEKANVNTLKGKKILWVDDYPENNDYPRQMLEQAGVIFDLALETESAINILRTKKFDLIISDMGRGSNHSAGLDLLKELKKIGINTPVVIFASSRALNRYGEEARALGAIAVTSGITDVLNVVQKELLSA